MTNIHPQAIISAEAELAPDVRIGPFCVVESGVRIGAGSVLHSHVIVCSGTVIGENTQVFQFSTLGEAPQDLKYRGEASTLEVGDHNIIRECVTIHRGTACDRGVTRVGDHNLIMAYCHIAHDCILGDRIIMANNASLAGHVDVGDYANLGGFTLVQQHCSIGPYVHSGKSSVISHDVPAFVLVGRNPARAADINREGLRRCNFSAQTIKTLRKAYKIFYVSRHRKRQSREQALEEMQALTVKCPEVEILAQSIMRSDKIIPAHSMFRGGNAVSGD